MKTFAVSLLAFLALAPGALGSTVEVRSVHEEEDSFITTVHVLPAAGEPNTMSISVTNGIGSPPFAVVHDDTAPVSAGTGCEQVDSQTVRCEPGDLDQVMAALGDMNDVATVDFTSRLAYILLSAAEGDDELSCTWCRMEGGPGDDELTGGVGVDDLQGEAGRDRLSGRDEGDSLYGGPDDDVMLGGAGHDQLYSGTLLNQSGPSGRDHLDGGPDHDTLSDFDGDPGPDTVIGGDGVDNLISYLGRSAPVFVDLTQTTGAGEEGENDSITGIENVDGGAAGDVIVGDAGPNRLDGGPGEDDISGGGGDDDLLSVLGFGNPLEGIPPDPAAFGPDRLAGGDGDDEILTDTAVRGDFTCDPGADLITLNSYVPGPSGTKPEPTPGPLVDESCERIQMLRFAVDPAPVRVGREGRLTFEFLAFRCCDRLFRLNRSTRPWRSYDKKRIDRRRVRVRAPRRLARRWRERPVMFRAKVDRAGDALFVWRFIVDRSG